MRGAYLDRVRRWHGAIGDEEDIVQDAFVRAAAGTRTLRDGGQGAEWFFRVLCSAYVDYRRRTDARLRLLVDVATEAVVARQALPDPPELGCACLHRGLASLRSDYRRALEVVELDGRTVVELAESAGITPNNAGVRLYRARRALARLTRACCRGCRASREGCSCAPALSLDVVV